jgi:mRNA interferase RelE/StbE
MSWNIKFDKSAFKELSKLDKPIQKKISLELEKISNLDNPKELGKALQGSLSGLWCYRVGDYRIICEIEYAIITISVIKIGDRKEVYR